MVEDVVFSNNHEMKKFLISIINDQGLSSVEAMSEQLDTSEDIVAEIIQNLVDEGVVFGRLTDDMKRFYKSDVKKSDATIVSTSDSPDLVKSDRGFAVYIPVIGLITFIAGQILHHTIGAANNGELYNYTSAIVMGGLLIIVLGLVYIATIDSKNSI